MHEQHTIYLFLTLGIIILIITALFYGYMLGKERFIYQKGKLKDIMDIIGLDKKTLVTVDGLDSAVIGLEENSNRIIYSVNKCIRIIMDKHNISEREALNYFTNICSKQTINANSPIWCYDNF